MRDAILQSHRARSSNTFSIDLLGQTYPPLIEASLSSNVKRLDTYGRGACALHSLFGEPIGAPGSEQYYKPQARWFVRALLEDVQSSQILELALHHKPTSTVLLSLWADLIKPFIPFNNMQASAEGRALWRCIPNGDKERLLGQNAQEKQQKIRLNAVRNDLDEALRIICVPSLEKTLLRVIARMVGLLPDTEIDFTQLAQGDLHSLIADASVDSWLQSPFQSDRFGIVHAKCTNIDSLDGVVPTEHVGLVETMYAALLYPDHCYDGLRRAFFCPTATERQEIVLVMLTEEVERQPP